MKTRLIVVLVLSLALALFMSTALRAENTAILSLGSQEANLGGTIANTHTISINTYAQTYTVHLPVALKNYGACSAFPTLLGPANSSGLDTIIPLFRWDSGNNPNATTLRLEVAKDANFTQRVFSLWSRRSRGIGEFRFSSNFDPATTYYWRAWLMCGDAQGPYSEMWSFTTGSGGTTLPAPALLAPANGSTVPTTPVTFQWSSVPGAVEYLVRWREVGEQWSIVDWVNEAQISVDWLSANTTYEWWVSARNDYAIGTNSDTWQFTMPAGVSSLTSEELDRDISVLEADGISNAFESHNNR